jgi:hypothetical protein
MAEERQHPRWRGASILINTGDSAAHGPRSRGRAAIVRVVRGGSWNNNQRNARCACRNRNVPANYEMNIGLRVVVSITSSHRPVNPVVHGRGTAPQENDSVAWPRSRPLAGSRPSRSRRPRRSDPTSGRPNIAPPLRPVGPPARRGGKPPTAVVVVKCARRRSATPVFRADAARGRQCRRSQTGQEQN